MQAAQRRGRAAATAARRRAAPRRQRARRGSSTTLTGCAEERHVAPSRQTIRAAALLRARSRCSASLARIQPRLLAQRGVDVAQRRPSCGALTARPSAPTTKPMLRRRARFSAIGDACPSSRLARRLRVAQQSARGVGAAPASARPAGGAVDRPAGRLPRRRRTGRAAATSAIAPQAARAVGAGSPIGLRVEAAHLGLDPGLDLAHQLVGARARPRRSACRSRRR